jgi:hypothetical protein
MERLYLDVRFAFIQAKNIQAKNIQDKNLSLASQPG